MFEQSTEICLRALAFLVSAGDGTVLQSREIADKLGISPTYVGKVLQPLARQGWIRAIKGRCGGWLMVANPRRLTVARVIEALEPHQGWQRCVIGHVECSDATACPFHETWKEAKEKMRSVMKTTTIDRLLDYLPPRSDGQPGR